MGLLSKLFGNKNQNPNYDTSNIPDIDWDSYRTAAPDKPSASNQVSDAHTKKASPALSVDYIPVDGDTMRQMYLDCAAKMHWKLTGSGTKAMQCNMESVQLNDEVTFDYDENTEKYSVLHKGEHIGFLPKTAGPKYRDCFEFDSSLAFIADFEEDAKGNRIPVVGVFIPGSTSPVSGGVSKPKQKTTKRSSAKQQICLPNSYVVIDTETTGLRANECEIVELAAIRVENRVPVKRFSTLIKPTEKIPASATEVNGITNWMVRKSPAFADVAPDFLNFIGDLPLVGHNISFDDKFISVSLKRIGEKNLSSHRMIDTLELARTAWPRYKNHKLQYLVEKLDLKTNGAHRALADCEATYQLFEAIRTKLEN